MQQFLRTVWPTPGPYLTAIPVQWTDKNTGENKKGFRHAAHDDVQSAVALATAQTSDRDAPQDVYFALGSIREKRRTGVRLKENISHLGAFWLDIDVRPDEPGKYVSFDIAAHSLKSFCSTYHFPKPLIVHSGGGLHVYWPLVTPLEKDKWNYYAALFSAVVKKHGLLADHGCTANCAAVLRPVGTYNWKTGSPREVRAITSVGKMDTDKVLARIAKAADTLKVQVNQSVSSLAIPGQNPAARTDAKALNQAAMAGAVEDVPSNPKRVVSKCQQLLAQVKDPARVDEPQWYAMIGCLRHAENGEQAVHAMSKGYPGYDATETDQKIAQHKAGGFGPSTCIAFENARPGGCTGCPYQGKITTPLQLGRERMALPAPTVEVKTHTGQSVKLTLPPAPAPYKRTINADGKTVVMVTITNADDHEEDIEIYDHDLFPCGIYYDERESKYYVSVRRYLPKDGWADFDVSLGSFFDKRNLAITLGDIGVVPMLHNLEHLVTYMHAYIKQLQESAKAAVVYAKMGWREDDTFVLPDRVITKAGSETVVPGRNTVNALRWKEPAGDIEEWKAVARLYEQAGLEPLQFAFGIGFAAPLFRFTNYEGMLISLVGAAGCGKSSAALLANSIWGHKRVGWADSQHDTLKAFYNKMGVLNNLPVTYDEITNLEPDDLSDLCYSVSKGEGRQRLNQDGSAKEDFGSWQTMMVVTSNASLHSRLTLAKADSSAEAARIFEYYVPSGTLSKQVADQYFDKLNYHYGLAGPIYMEYVLNNVNSIRDRVQHWMRVVDQQAKVSSGERFWSAAPACVLAGFEAANACGLTNVDIPRVLAFAVSVIEKMRVAVSTSIQNGFAILSDYLNSNLDKTLTIGQEPQANRIALVTQEPRGKLCIRYEQWRERLYIDRADFRKYCAQQSLDPARLREELVTHGVLIEEKKHVLGKHTNYGRIQTWCWVLDMANPKMGGAHAGLNATTAREVANQAVANAQSSK